MNEDYVSFEVAKLLKEKGFDWECQAFYNINGVLAASPVHTINDELEDSDIACPTLYTAQKWLREERGIEVVIVPYDAQKRTYQFHVWDYKGLVNFIEPSSKSDGNHNDYGQCLNDGILEALKFI